MVCLDRVTDILAVTRPNHAELSDDEDHVWLKAKRTKVDRQKAAVGDRVPGSTARGAGVHSVVEPGLEEWSGTEGVPVDSANGASNEEGSDLDSGPSEDSDGYMETDSECVESDGAACDEEGSPEEGTESDEVGSAGEAEMMQQLAALKGHRWRDQKEKGEEKVFIEGDAVGETAQVGSKYVPPGRRSKGEGEGGERKQLQLKKKLNGLVNRWVENGLCCVCLSVCVAAPAPSNVMVLSTCRLSEANLPSILTQVEQMYRNNSRNGAEWLSGMGYPVECVAGYPVECVVEYRIECAVGYRVECVVGWLQPCCVSFPGCRHEHGPLRSADAGLCEADIVA